MEDGIADCKYNRANEINKTCVLPRRYVCDHEIDCHGGKDECNCSSTFQCDTPGECVVKTMFCDNRQRKGRPGCLDRSDERRYNRKTKNGFQCPVRKTLVRKVCVLPEQYVCDGDPDCDFGIDECLCGGPDGAFQTDGYSNENCFRCFDGSFIIPNVHVCDGIVHCADLSDECACLERRGNKRPEICDAICQGPECDCPGKVRCHRKRASTNKITTFPCLPKFADLRPPDLQTSMGVQTPQDPPESEMLCLDANSICDDTFDCENEIDEKFCPIDEFSFPCADGSKRIESGRVCNGRLECADKSDELDCYKDKDYFCKNFFDTEAEWKNLSKSEVYEEKKCWVDFDRPLFVKKCDGIPLCRWLDDECSEECEHKAAFCNYTYGRAFVCPNSGSRIIGMEVCDGKPTCNDTAPHLSEDELHCPNRFYCNDRGNPRLPIHIPQEAQCNGKLECGDKSDELNCNSSTHFYCNDTGSVLFVSPSQVCDDKKDCKEGLDECQHCTQSLFSSPEKLISSRVLVVFLWAIGIFAVIGNSATIIHQIVSIIRPNRNSTAAAAINRILLLNLCLADLLVGIYLIGLGIKDSTVFKYCIQDQDWRSSSTCTALGSVALVGTEASVFMLLIMTGCRLHAIVKPFERQRRRVIGFAVAVAWALACVLAFLPFAPLFEDYFVSCVWFQSHPFFGKICRNELQQFTKKLVLLEGDNQTFSSAVRDGYSWKNMFVAMSKLNPDYVPDRYFGYYSAHSVCLPRLFPDPNVDDAWGYSLFLILINFFAFLFILVSYIYIYRLSTKVTVRKVQVEDVTSRMQKKVARIVLTDFFCWMPICIMAFLTVAGVKLSGTAYAVTAIILMPINSAMNPFVYSNILDIIWAKMLPVRTWFGATLCGRQLQKIFRQKESLSRRKTEIFSTETENVSVTTSSSRIRRKVDEETTF